MNIDTEQATEQRRTLRASLIRKGFLRTDVTRDFGDGAYVETFTGPLGVVRIEWAPKPLGVVASDLN